jgi:hypothetical protein
LYEKITDSTGNDIDEGLRVSILRNDSVVWYSNPLLKNGCGTLPSISGFCDLNNDGFTEVFISRHSGSHGEIEDLWIMSIDQGKGRLLNSIDNDCSNIVGAFDTFKIMDSRHNGFRDIVAIDVNSENQLLVHYLWNGSFYEKKVNLKKSH